MHNGTRSDALGNRGSTSVHALVAAAALAGLAGCSVGPEVGGSSRYASNAPDIYTEARVMFVGALESVDQHDLDRRPLIHPFEFEPNTTFAFSHETGAFTRARPPAVEPTPGPPNTIQSGFMGGIHVDEHGRFHGTIQGEFARVPTTLPVVPGTGPRPIERNRHLGVIVRGVRLPEDMRGRRDIAVILDIVTKAREPVTSMVVYYERDVPGGQMLNFQNLAVFYEDKWDGFTPPYFRLRVLDVKAERNARARDLLDRASNLGAAVTGLVPHPIIPAVSVAIEAAKLVLGNQRNQVLIDYQVNFYSLEQFRGSGRADLGILAEGEWLVLGRPQGLPAWSRSNPPPLPDQAWYQERTTEHAGAAVAQRGEPAGATTAPSTSTSSTAGGTPGQERPAPGAPDPSNEPANAHSDSEVGGQGGGATPPPAPQWSRPTPGRLRPTASNFWEQPLTLMRRSGQVVYSDGGVVAAPYVSVVITSAKMNVPTHVMDRSQQLITLLSTPGNASDTTGLSNALEALASSMSLHVARSRILQHQSIQEVARLAALLERNIVAIEREGVRLISVEEEAEIVRFATEIVPGQQFVDAAAFIDWWDATGRTGHLAPSDNPSHRHGVIWKAGSPSAP